MNINDVVVFKKEHFNKARKIVKQMIGDINTILIGGESGTGKTEVALILTKMFYKAEMFSIDQYYKVPAYKRTAWRKRTKLRKIGVQEIDWDDLAYDVEKSKAEMVIIEGLYAQHLIGGFSVFLEGNYEQTLEFRKKRKKEMQTSFRREVLRREQWAITKLKRFADMVIAYEA